MYNEFDSLLEEETTIDSWYDDGFLIAQDILKQFSEKDWKLLINNVSNKDIEWQMKLAYCIDNQIIVEELQVIEKLMSSNDIELWKMCIDALRVFDNELGYEYVRKHPDIITEIKKRNEQLGAVEQRIFNDFIEKFSSY